MGAVENVKEVAELLRKYNDIELNRRILNLENEVLDLSREKRRAEEKSEQLERLLHFKEKLTFGEPFYWLEKDKTPYCPACWEDKHKAVHIVFSFDNGKKARFDCPTCGHMYLLESTTWHNLQAKFQ